MRLRPFWLYMSLCLVLYTYGTALAQQETQRAARTIPLEWDAPAEGTPTAYQIRMCTIRPTGVCVTEPMTTGLLAPTVRRTTIRVPNRPGIQCVEIVAVPATGTGIPSNRVCITQ
jgi:hypothetical protein